MARTRPAGRPIRLHLAVRYPSLVPPVLALSLGVPHVPTRHALVMRNLKDTENAFNRGDFEAAMAGLAPDVAFETPPGFPDSGTLHGRQAVTDFYAEAMSSAELHYDEIVRADPTAMVATWRLRFTGVETKLAFEMHGAQTFEVARGRVHHVHATLEGSRQL